MINFATRQKVRVEVAEIKMALLQALPENVFIASILIALAELSENMAWQLFSEDDEEDEGGEP